MSNASSSPPSPPLDVVLLKSADQPVQNAATARSDRYVERLQNDARLRLGRVKHVNLLEFQLCNADALRARLAEAFVNQFGRDAGAPRAYRSVIITSKQTVEAFDAAMLVGSVLRPDFARLLLLQQQEEASLASCGKLTVYCVGQATLDRFQALVGSLATAGLDLSTRLQLKVTTSGDADGKKHKQNSQELARLIVADFEEAHSNAAGYEHFAFYPCSAIRKDDLGDEFKRVGLKHDELFVYTTGPSVTGVRELRQLVVENELERRPTCLVFFSPSGVEAAFEGWSGAREDASLLRFVSVGPATSAKLRPLVDKVSEMAEPSPDALVDLLLAGL